MIAGKHSFYNLFWHRDVIFGAFIGNNRRQCCRDYRIIRNIKRHDRIGSDQDIIANRDAAQYDCPRADEHAVSNFGNTAVFSPDQYANRHALRQVAIVADLRVAMDYDSAKMPDIQSFADFCAVRNIKAIFVFQSPQPQIIEVKQQPVSAPVILAISEDDRKDQPRCHLDEIIPEK